MRFTYVNADVAQMVEQRFRKPQVTGSNPVVGSILRWHQCGERNCRTLVSTETDRLSPDHFCCELRPGSSPSPISMIER
jgi:hypothetical protein